MHVHALKCNIRNQFSIIPNKEEGLEANMYSAGGSDELINIVSNSNLRICFTPTARFEYRAEQAGHRVIFSPWATQYLGRGGVAEIQLSSRRAFGRSWYRQ